MTRYYRIKGNWFTFTCSFGVFIILLLVLFSYDIYIMSIIGVFPYFMLIMVLVGSFFIPWMLFPIILWTKKWFLSITQDGITDNAFGFKRIYPWSSIRSHEVKQTPAYYKGRYKHELILKLESKTVHLQLDKYGIDTESELSRFATDLETQLLGK